MDYEEYKRKALEPIVNYIESVMASYSKEELEARIKKALPENESEDERIRNEIITFIEQAIHSGGGTIIPEEKEDKWIAYLEKQKEQKHKIACWKSLGECLDIPDGHHVVGWFHNGDFRLGIMCNGLFVDTNGLRAEQPKEVFYIPNADEEFVYAEQKSAEWSKEDKQCLDVAIEILENLGYDGEADNLKHLRPQPHWKPSEKQMIALEWKINNTPVGAWQRKELESLYNDLKKLI